MNATPRADTNDSRAVMMVIHCEKSLDLLSISLFLL